ncbi:MAG TPA: DUF4198 domain-containing protein [Pyrinomonadaceae bacterium]|nr:DUF4198 domain-containing protein [Pyrinomonadaceae bacterium]HRK52005.1 DUF4198 domain-containing protein [Pyrinomonadaceae bacterium]
MKTKKITALFLISLLLSLPVFGHDLFFKLDSYFVKVNKKISISVMNGTFQKSEGAVTFARLTDMSVVSPSGAVSHPVEANLTKNETTAFLNVTPTEAGNYIAGLSTMWRESALPAAEFNKYLPAEGIPDILEARTRDGELDKDARYRYSKYVKTIFQAGNKATDNYNTILGYAVEMVPQQNPYKLKRGSSLDILCLKDGKPLAGQIVTTGYEAAGKMLGETSARTDKDGMIKVKLTAAGKWYAKFINMVKIDDPKLNYESKWATLTFEIK